MNQFLNSKSMVTPGVAGGVVTLIAGTLSSQFGLPAKWIALLASLLVALLIFFADQAALPEKSDFSVQSLRSLCLCGCFS